MQRLAIGTVQFGLAYGIANREGQIPLATAREILEYAAARDVDTLDTAIAYGDSEQRLGEIGVGSWSVISKLPPLPADCPDVKAWVSDSVTGSLHRLRLPRLAGLLLHRSQDLLESRGDQLYSAMENLKRDGVVQSIGVSIYDPADLSALTRGRRLDLVQAPFNVLDRRLLESGWMRRLANEGTELHVRSVFLQGLLLMPPAERPRKFARWKSLWEAFDGWVGASGMTPVEACLRYALSFPEVGRAVVGVETLTQLSEIIRAANGSPAPAPGGFNSRDVDLINPSRWNDL